MSSNTTVRVTPTVYDVLGQDVLILDRFLGPGGRALLLDTLKALPEIRESNPATAGQLDWEQVEGEDRFETTVDQTRISLRITGAIAELSYVDRFEAYESLYQETARKLQGKVHKKVNQLLAIAVGRRLTQKVKQYHNTSKVDLRITQSVANKLNVRTKAFYKTR